MSQWLIDDNLISSYKQLQFEATYAWPIPPSNSITLLPPAPDPRALRIILPIYLLLTRPLLTCYYVSGLSNYKYRFLQLCNACPSGECVCRGARRASLTRERMEHQLIWVRVTAERGCQIGLGVCDVNQDARMIKRLTCRRIEITCMQLINPA